MFSPWREAPLQPGEICSELIWLIDYSCKAPGTFLMERKSCPRSSDPKNPPHWPTLSHVGPVSLRGRHSLFLYSDVLQKKPQTFNLATKEAFS